MRPRDRIALALVAATLVFTELALGGAVRWAAVAGSLGGIASAIPYITSRRALAKRPLLLVLVLAGVALTALQLIPMPAAIAHAIFPQKVALVTDNAHAWGEAAPTWVMASYDPPATLVELAKYVGYAALAFTALRLAADRGNRRVLGMVVVGAATLVAIVTFANTAAGTHDVYGFITPPVKHPLVTPILNDNHFASLMDLAMPVALVLALTSKRLVRLGWLAAALVCAAAGFLISSRGGAIGLVIGAVTTGLLLLAQRRIAQTGHRRRRRSLQITAVVIGACVSVLLVAFTARQVTSELQSTHIDDLVSNPAWKVQTWVHSMPMLEANPWLGVGRGAFDQAFMRYSPLGSSDFQYAENTYLEVVLDWGIPGGALVLLLASAIAIAGLRRWKHSPLEAGVLGALAALAAHDIVDFSLELPAVAMTAIVLVAMLVPAVLETRSNTRLRWVRLGLLVPAAIACVLAALPFAQLAHDAADDLDGDPAEQLAAAKAASDAHPSDYLLMGRAAQGLVENNDPRAPAVVNRALYLNPQHEGLHRIAGIMLLHAGQTQQAQAELAAAVADARAPLYLVQEIASTFPDPDQAAAALPIDMDSAPRVVGALLALRAPDLDLAYTKRLATFNAGEPLAQLMYARAAIVSNQPEVALGAARAAYQLQPDTKSATALAQAMALTGDPSGGIAVLRTALAGGIIFEPSDRADALIAIADLQLASGAFKDVADTMKQLEPFASTVRTRAALHQRLAAMHDGLGEHAQAHWERQQVQSILHGGS